MQILGRPTTGKTLKFDALPWPTVLSSCKKAELLSITMVALAMISPHRPVGQSTLLSGARVHGHPLHGSGLGDSSPEQVGHILTSWPMLALVRAFADGSYAKILIVGELSMILKHISIDA